MALAINPKDPQTFASACLDHTVKVWSLGNSVPNFSLEAHEKGVNYVDYYHGGDKPYIVTTGDDRLVCSSFLLLTMLKHSLSIDLSRFGITTLNPACKPSNRTLPMSHSPSSTLHYPSSSLVPKTVRSRSGTLLLIDWRTL